MDDHSSSEDTIIGRDTDRARGSHLIAAYASAVKNGSRIRTSCESIYDTDKWHIEPDGFINEARRAGGPHLCTLPADTDMLNNDHPQSHILEDWGFMQHLMSTLTRHDVYALSIKLRKCEPYFDDSFHDAHQAALIIGAFRDSFDDSWLLACRQIWKYLSDTGHGQVNVEISDPVIHTGGWWAPVVKTDPLWSANEELKCRILRELDLSDMRKFTTLNLGMSLNRKKTQQAVIVLIRHDSDRDWRGTRDHIVDILDDLELSMVEVIVTTYLWIGPESSRQPIWIDAR
ncbi:hypothetical protein N7475_008892 [Penicillium sp. IBT 31633x]|nr:hypothetical protein N7475_008892 [Penicillium sp. IBT 31633x]